MTVQYKYNFLIDTSKMKNQINLDNNTINKIIKWNKLQHTIG
jgi:hypothetical protein